VTARRAPLVRDELATPVGRLVLLGRDGRLLLLAFLDGWSRQRRFLHRRLGDVEIAPGRLEATRHLADYFDGDLGAIAALRVDPGGTPFQNRVWRRLRRIPAGTTRAYGELAALLGTSRASRAVGAAAGANPVSIVIPCHRLVGADGSLVDYAFGLRRKRWLLTHEARYARG